MLDDEVDISLCSGFTGSSVNELNTTVVLFSKTAYQRRGGQNNRLTGGLVGEIQG